MHTYLLKYYGYSKLIRYPQSRS